MRDALTVRHWWLQARATTYTETVNSRWLQAPAADLGRCLKEQFEMVADPRNQRDPYFCGSAGLLFRISQLPQGRDLAGHLRGDLAALPAGGEDDLSPKFHPGLSRVCSLFEPVGLGGATGRGAKPPVERSAPSRCIAG